MEEKKLFEIISKQLDISIEDITLDSSFNDDLRADSLDQVEMIMAVEEEFGIIIDDNNAEKFKTPRDVLQYLSALKK